MLRRIQHPKLFSELISGFLLVMMVSSCTSALLCPYLAGSSHKCGSSAAAVHEGAAHHTMTNHDHMHHEQTAETPESSNVVSISEPRAQCPHCLEHSLSAAITTLKNLVPAVPSSDIAEGNTSSDYLRAFQSTMTLMDLHGHSPPGSNTSRHILINTFRI